MRASPAKEPEHASADLCHLSQRPRRRRAEADRRRDPGRDRIQPGGAGPRRDGDRAAHAPHPRRQGARPFQRAARLDRRADQPRGRQDRRRLCRQLPARPAVGDGDPQPVRSRDRHAQGDARRHQHHRDAHRRRHRARRQVSRAQGQQGARPHRRARHRLLERAPARQAVRVRRDPRAFAPQGKPRGVRRRSCRATSARRSWRSTTGKTRSRAPTSWSKPRA